MGHPPDFIMFGKLPMITKKMRRLVRPARKIKQGEIVGLRLRNHVTQNQMVHEHVRVLGCACCHEPWRPG